MDPERVNALLGTFPPRSIRYLERGARHREADFPTPRRRHHPSWRARRGGIADLAEEVARFYGYNNIPSPSCGSDHPGGYSAEQKLERSLGRLCRACGYDEIITYSFISPTYYDKIRWARTIPAASPSRS